MSDESPVPHWAGEPFLLCVAQHRSNKNIPLLLRVFHRLLTRGELVPETRLVLIGIRGPESVEIHRTLARLELSRSVTMLEGLADAQLQWCYRNALTLVAPSSIEGFGLPVAEALLAGCRVVCSDIPAFREVGHRHCQYFALDSFAEVNLADAIVAARSTPRPPPVLLTRFSSRVIGQQYVEIYKSLLTSPSRAGRAAHQMIHLKRRAL